MCLKGTRDRFLLKKILTFSVKLTSFRKSSIGKHNLCTRWRTTREFQDFDLACFFCKRDEPSLSKPEWMIPTLAERISRFYASY